MRLLIYTPTISPRVKYIFSFIFGEILLADFDFTSSPDIFLDYQGPKFSYAEQPLANEAFFEQVSLLRKNNIEPFEIELTLFGDKKVPFATVAGILPFDVFAASFYFVSRYEEYLPFEADRHGRYRAELSLQYKLGLLDVPIVDEWALLIKKVLLDRFPDMHFGKKKYEFIPTIDVDRAYHFKANSWLRNTGRMAKALLTADTERIKNMIGTALGKKDPFDTYSYLNRLHCQHQLGAIYFFLLSKRGHPAFDLNIDPESPQLKALLNTLRTQAPIGIHPSYSSNSHHHKLAQELDTLTTLIGKRPIISRQHFLKITLPKTYLQLLKAGIQHDYTMGYASQIGFRAGTCTPFFWYDVQLEKQTLLKIHPFAIMDVSLRQYLSMSPTTALQAIEKLVIAVKNVNGTLYTLWHNESVSETGPYKGWRIVYEQLLKKATT